MKPMEPMQPMEGMKPMQPMKPMEPMKSAGSDRWWPASLGDSPNSMGGQNQARYAYFADRNRLAVDQGDGKVSVYDTGDRHVSGVQQDQSGDDGNLAFSDGAGTFRLSDLQKVSD